jgi:hypothetical protein
VHDAIECKLDGTDRSVRGIEYSLHAELGIFGQVEWINALPQCGITPNGHDRLAIDRDIALIGIGIDPTQLFKRTNGIGR